MGGGGSEGSALRSFLRDGECLGLWEIRRECGAEIPVV